ncbi:TerD family protein [Kitasatospora aureofaciens]|uniref:TerD family protein n=1 Tax=Kitasatospora aureofaciens TaxID=1894 RepID=UPI001C43AE5E|nr:TerD family protein [Kitasatospora aureofaciens]MBV6697740.1 TerD family protein [Kitasatospora aureofaciens]
MGVGLTKGGNVSLGKQAPGLRVVQVGLGWTAGAGYDLDASALLCGRSGKVISDRHFVFFNNLQSPDGSVRHHGNHGGDGAGGGDVERIDVRLADVPAEVERIVFAVAIYDAAQRSQTFGQVRGAYIRLTDPDGGEVARYDVAPEAGSETAMVFGELYRHGADWKFRAVGQGYAAGLAGVATDFGVEGLQSAPAPAPAPAPASVSAPVVADAPAAPTTRQEPGSSPVTCFFDPSHGVGSTAVLWSPQWGVPRQIQACVACAQRVQTTPPPFYSPQQGYPQPVQQRYPQQGYPQVPGQGQPAQGGRRYGTGALLGAGAAGLVGGALLNEALSDDEPEVVINNYYEGDDDDFF